MTTTNQIFAAEYAFEVLDESPTSDEEVHCYPPDARHGQDGPMLRLRPAQGRSWIAKFAFGKLGSSATHVLTMPDPRRICVVARGAGYLVSVRTPSSWEPVSTDPILDVVAAPSAGLVLFASHTDILAHDRDGERWRTGRIAWDGLRISTVEGHTLVGEYDDIRSDAAQRFEVDLRTGAVVGGID